jgi:hypothetical protein
MEGIPAAVECASRSSESVFEGAWLGQFKNLSLLGLFCPVFGKYPEKRRFSGLINASLENASHEFF